MAQSKQPKKSRNFMYTQQISRLPNSMTPNDLYSLVDNTLKPKRWGGITHDQDMKDDNVTPADEHVHVMLQFDNARSVNQLAKDIGDAPQSLEIWNDKVDNGFAYLIHATKNSRHKHQYSVDEVRANFDYSAFMQQLMKKAAKVEGLSSTNKINGILDMVGAGEMTLKEAKAQLSGSAYARASAKLSRAHELYLERRADALHKEMEANNELVAVHWFYGMSETGKTFLAQKLAQEIGDCYLTSTERDAFQYYQAEPVIILDELRPGTIPFSELLTLFNPFSRGKTTVSSRYQNKPLACRAIFITSPFSPAEYCRRSSLDYYDTGGQLYRRLSSVLKFDEDFIYRMRYDESRDQYVAEDQKANAYSKKNQTAYQLNNVFDTI